LRNTPGVELLDTFRTLPGEFRDKPYQLTASDFTILAQVNNLLWRQTPFSQQSQPTGTDGIAIINERFAALFNVQQGDILQMPFPSGAKSLWIMGIQVDYSSDRPTLLIDSQNL
ncbi:hypothetical protein RZS08_49200, partial [Arthrospira platensis SPKY1]|nr:hypothetical protein [Arthrospira platensis SPKY1]